MYAYYLTYVMVHNNTEAVEMTLEQVVIYLLSKYNVIALRK
jgi:hypothetical protein